MSLKSIIDRNTYPLISKMYHVYHGYFEFVLECLTKNLTAADIIVSGILSGDFLFYIDKVCCMYSLELPG